MRSFAFRDIYPLGNYTRGFHKVFYPSFNRLIFAPLWFVCVTQVAISHTHNAYLTVQIGLKLLRQHTSIESFTSAMLAFFGDCTFLPDTPPIKVRGWVSVARLHVIISSFQNFVEKQHCVTSQERVVRFHCMHYIHGCCMSKLTRITVLRRNPYLHFGNSEVVLSCSRVIERMEYRYCRCSTLLSVQIRY